MCFCDQYTSSRPVRDRLVITMDMIGKIRRMHGRDKKTKREIARAKGLSRYTVASTCLVSVARTRYSVPCEWAGHMVSTRLYPDASHGGGRRCHRGHARAPEWSQSEPL